jgi:2-polyprenyl-3-methyl-5-hydroxy-6-metoxy-1,4-benzoquinol methylase
MNSNGKFVCQNHGHSYHEKEGIIQLIQNAASAERYFPDNAFDLLYHSEEENFWFRVRNRIIGNTITRYLSSRSRILEVGCGTGFVSRYLKQRGFHIECADLSFEALQFCKKRDSGYAYYQYNLAERIFLEEFDGICAFDVLEHFKDDARALKNMYEALKPGGVLFITVPADMRLWSAMDVYAEHKRRYSAQDLRKKLEMNGFNIMRMSYFMAFLFPVLLLSRKFLLRRGLSNTEESVKIVKQEVVKELQPNTILNSLFYVIFSTEVPLLRSFNLPFGSSLLCVAMKERSK